MWGRCDCATSIIFTIFVTGFLVLMHQIGLSIKESSTTASSNSLRDFEEGSLTTLTPLGRFDAFGGRAEGLNNPGGEILLVLGKVEA